MAKIRIVSTLDEVNRLFESSVNRPVVIFKHSKTCGISSDVLESVNAIDGEINVVVVQDARHVSDHIAGQTGIRHHSPQAFVIRNGKVVYHATHYGINPAQIQNHLTIND